jgi:2',3'-cyclic-nucleotide 2'-phosphodiesterase (5'-nucleotidase family)
LTGDTLIHKSGQNGYYLGRIDLEIHKTEGIKLNDSIVHMKTVSVFPQWKMILNKGYSHAERERERRERNNNNLK